MMEHFRKIYLLLLLLCFFLKGCITSIDVKGDLDEANAEKITCLVNGEPFEAVNGKGLLAVDFVMTELEEDERSFLMTIYAVELLDEGGALAVGFNLGGEKLANLKTGDTFTTWEPLDSNSDNYIGVLGGVEKRVSVQTDENIYKASSNHTGKISLTITAIDHVAKNMSGTFSFNALDDETSIQIDVTEGVFQNISWEQD